MLQKDSNKKRGKCAPTDTFLNLVVNKMVGQKYSSNNSIVQIIQYIYFNFCYLVYNIVWKVTQSYDNVRTFSKTQKLQVVDQSDLIDKTDEIKVFAENQEGNNVCNVIIETDSCSAGKSFPVKLWRVVKKFKLLDMVAATKSNFILKLENSSADAEDTLESQLKSRATLMTVDERAALFSVTSEKCNVFHHKHGGAFLYEAQYKTCDKLVEMELNSFVEYFADSRFDIPVEKVSILLIPNTGRCGSTLLIQLLESYLSHSTVSISEPDFFNYLVNNKTDDAAFRKKLIKACINSLYFSACNVSENQVKVLVLKPMAHTIGCLHEVIEVFPTSEYIYMYRTPLSYIRSLYSISQSFTWLQTVTILLNEKLNTYNLILNQYPRRKSLHLGVDKKSSVGLPNAITTMHNGKTTTSESKVKAEETYRKLTSWLNVHQFYISTFVSLYTSNFDSLFEQEDMIRQIKQKYYKESIQSGEETFEDPTGIDVPTISNDGVCDRESSRACMFSYEELTTDPKSVLQSIAQMCRLDMQLGNEVKKTKDDVSDKQSTVVDLGSRNSKTSFPTTTTSLSDEDMSCLETSSLPSYDSQGDSFLSRSKLKKKNEGDGGRAADNLRNCKVVESVGNAILEKSNLPRINSFPTCGKELVAFVQERRRLQGMEQQLNAKRSN